MTVNISINDDLELHAPIAEEKRWPWTDKWLDYQRDKLGLTEEQCKEIEKKANDKFAEMARENAADYSDETKKRIHDDIEHIYLHSIVESVIKYTPQDIINSHTESAAVGMAGVVATGSVIENVTESEKPNQVAQKDVVEKNVVSDAQKSSESKSKDVAKDMAIASMAAALVSESVVEDESEEVKKRRKMAEESSASNQSSGQVSESKTTTSEKDKVASSEASPNQATLPTGIGVVAASSVLSDTTEKSVSHKGNLTKHQTEELLGQFKNYGMSIGIPGGTRSKVRELAENTSFLFDYKDKLVSNVNNGVVELTFNGNCANRHYIELKNGCHVGIDYDRKTGAIKILKDVLFHKSGDQFDYTIDLKKTGGLFGKSDLEKVLGSKDAAEDVKKSLKDLKLIACSNPNLVEGIDPESQPRRQTAAMVDGKSHGSQLTTGQKIALAAGLVVIGAATALTGVGILFGGAAVAAAAGVAVSAISGAGVAASSGVIAAASIVSSNSVFAADKVASGTVHLVNHIGNSEPSLPASDIASVVNNSVDKVATVFTNLGNNIASGSVDVANKIASGATNLGNEIANQFGNASGNGSSSVSSSGSSSGSSSSTTVASEITKIANNPLTVPVSIGVGAGILGGVTAAAAYDQKSKGTSK